MDLFFIMLPALLIVVLYFVVFTRRGEAQKAKNNFKNFDWITNLLIIFGCIALMDGLYSLGIEIPFAWSITILAVYVAVLCGIVFYRIRKGKRILGCADDERTSQIYSKSSRNALFVTFLALLFILSRAGTSVDTKALVIMLAAGIVTLFGSMFFYYYRES